MAEERKQEELEQEPETVLEQQEPEAAAEPEKDQETPEAPSEEKPEEAEEEGKDKKTIFSRKKDKKEEALKNQIEELQDKLMRRMAEFENFRKRTDKEKTAMYEVGARSVIEKILPVVDNFERGLAMVPEENREEPFVDGMNKIYRQLMAELANLGVKPIEAVGQEFNPELHNAVMQVENEELESGTVAQELQKGYLYKDTVVRHSMVAVVQ